MELLAPDWPKFVDEIVPNLISLAKTNKLADGRGQAHVVSIHFASIFRTKWMNTKSNEFRIFQEITEFLTTLASQFELSKVQLDAIQAAELNALLNEFKKIEL